MAVTTLDIVDVRNQLPRNGAYSKRPLSAITKIAAHWDAWQRPHEYDSIARYVQEAQMHINKDWGGGAHGDGIMYHYKIDNTGVVFWTRSHEDLLWNVGGQANYNTLAVSFDCGEFQQPTREQIEAFYLLMENLCFEHPEFPASQGDVFGHFYFNATACPGVYKSPTQMYRETRSVNAAAYTYDWPVNEPVVNIPAPVVPVAPAPTPTPDPVVPPKVDVKPVEDPNAASVPVTESPNNEHNSQKMADGIFYLVKMILNWLRSKFIK